MVSDLKLFRATLLTKGAFAHATYISQEIERFWPYVLYDYNIYMQQLY